MSLYDERIQPALTWRMYSEAYGKTNAAGDYVGGVSKSEYRRYCILSKYLYVGLIDSLACQPKFILRDAVSLKANGVYSQDFKQSRETYTADFMYSICGHTIVEDVKGAKLRGKKRRPYPYIKTAARNKHKALISLWQRDGLLKTTSLVLSGEYRGEWIFWNPNGGLIDFELWRNLDVSKLYSGPT